VAAEYLTQWLAKQDGNSDSGWHFNKATQAWLIRHAYEPDRVAKDIFKLLLRYLEGLQGIARDRLRTQASAIVLLQGAPLAEEPNEVAKEGKNKKRKSQLTPEVEDEPKARPPPLPDAEAAEPDEAEVERRKMRMKRAQQVLKVVGEEADDG
ncbi:unnamed protein product, partial [Polarella glacialis]